MVEELRFLVQGSSDDPYRVTFVRPGEGELLAYCTCPAGENGQYCKHRFRLIQGEREGLISGSEEDVRQVGIWIRGTVLEAEIARMRELEEAIVELRTELSRRKKAVAKAMRG